MIYHGYRGQEQKGIRVTKGSFATEGEGVYIALDPGLAHQFAGSGRYLQELEFTLENPLDIGIESLYGLGEEPEIEEPINNSDSDWLKANKLAYQNSVKEEGNNWSKAQDFFGYYLTQALRDMGYDGVIVDQGKDNRWAVVFDPENVKLITQQIQSHSIRSTRIALALVGSK